MVDGWIGATVVYTQECEEMEVDRAMPNDELSAMVDNVIVLNISQRRHTHQRYISIIKMRDRHFDPRVQPFHMEEPRACTGFGPQGCRSRSGGLSRCYESYWWRTTPMSP